MLSLSFPVLASAQEATAVTNPACVPNATTEADKTTNFKNKCNAAGKTWQDTGKNGEDNCPTANNPNQTDRNFNGIGDACDIEYQKSIREKLKSEANSLINNHETTKKADQSQTQFQGKCIADPSQIGLNNTNNTCSKQESLDGKFLKLKQAFDNKMIVSVLEEPISTENIFTRAQVCTTKYLRDKNGLLQFTTPKADAQTDINWDDKVATPEGQISKITQPLSDLNIDEKVSIAIDSCKTAYVDPCNPQNTFSREIELNKPLPTIITCSTVQLIFAESGVDLIKQYVGLIYRWATGIIGIVAVLVIMVNGIMISTAGGDDGKVSAAKERIIQSLTALAILFFAGIILYSINPNYFTANDINNPTETTTPAGAEQEVIDGQINSNSTANKTNLLS